MAGLFRSLPAVCQPAKKDSPNTGLRGLPVDGCPAFLKVPAQPLFSLAGETLDQLFQPVRVAALDHPAQIVQLLLNHIEPAEEIVAVRQELLAPGLGILRRKVGSRPEIGAGELTHFLPALAPDGC